MRIITPNISYIRSISWTTTSKCVIWRKCLLVTRACKSARSKENETTNGQEVLLPQRLRCDAFISFQRSTNLGVVRWPRSTQHDFHRTKYCLRGLSRPCFTSLSSTISPSQLYCSQMTTIQDCPPANPILPSLIVSPSKPVEWKEGDRGFERWWGLEGV